VPVKLTMTSEDVIHSFYVPAFRVKRDVVPGRYTKIWFEADQDRRYHLFCAEYCGTEHSEMVGWVTVMEPEDYQRWLSASRAANRWRLCGGGACSNERLQRLPRHGPGWAAARIAG
jgi:heme/copper-type cytochrome/quinol oxidase subunit 2